MISYWREHRRRRWCLHLRNRNQLPATGEQPCDQAEPLPVPQELRRTVVATMSRVEIIDPAGIRFSLPLTELVTFIGSGRGCRWRFREAGLDPRHLALIHLAEGVYVLDLHGARRMPTMAAGQWLVAGKSVRVGRLQLSWRRVIDAPAATGLPPLYLQWTSGGSQHRELLRARVTLFGSSPWCAVRSNSIAPLQAALIRRPDDNVLIDLADNTWTRQSATPVRLVHLEPGDQFEIGPTSFELRSEWAETAAPASTLSGAGGKSVEPLLKS